MLRFQARAAAGEDQGRFLEKKNPNSSLRRESTSTALLASRAPDIRVESTQSSERFKSADGRGTGVR